MISTRESLQSLLHHLIDYAGLFPPAKLDMPTTVQNYASFLKTEDAWMLGRLILPIARLDEFDEHAADLLPRDPEGDPWTISGITSPAVEHEAMMQDLDRITLFNEKHEDAANGLAKIDVIELKANTPEDIDRALDVIQPEVFPFVEFPISEDPRGLIATLAGGDAGAKVRTGGVTADLYPAPEHVARFIAACAGSDVPFKATAGLHHPLRQYSETVQTKEFGFLNVFVAGCLAMAHELDVDVIQQILETESLDVFKIEDDRINWRGHILSAEEIDELREDFATSFGSCSFDEPREDLRALKLL
ncbi:MAG: hypothetical protein EA377_11935 [Phycisphaerales bacterium]|nr:MAG: hypothetical protein EA377_11935 [Phycisphaerales bacterium]